MALQDHFHPPLSVRRHWHAFHNAWATYIASDLNQRLPEGYFAEPNVQFGIEIDVAAFEEEPKRSTPDQGPPLWGLVLFPVREGLADLRLWRRAAGRPRAGPRELLAPANKDRPAHRDALLSKCA